MNVRSVKLAIRVQMIFTIAKVGVLCIIIVGGFVKLAEGWHTCITVCSSNTHKVLSSLAWL